MIAHVGPVGDPRRYTLAAAEPIAGGGQGFVYRGTRREDGRPVAIKQLTALGPAAWPEHRRRLRLVAGVGHRALGRHLDAFLGPPVFTGDPPPAEDFDIPYSVMAWVEGRPLSVAVADADLADVLGWVRDVAHATGALHHRPTPDGLGIVHRDVKPSNVLVTPEGAVLVDFGIARPAQGPTATIGAGSPGWIPPEALAGEASGPAGDLWQVAGLASWALLGEPPAARDGDRHRHRLRRALAERGHRDARALAHHIDAGLAPTPGARPGDVVRWGDRLVEGGLRRRRHRRLAAVASAALALAGVATGLARAGPGGDPPAGATGPGPAPVVTVDAPPGPLGFGETVVATVEVPAGVAPAGARVRLQALSGGAPAPGAARLDEGVTTAGPHRSRLAFTVGAGPGDGTPVIVDQIEVEVVAAGGSGALRRLVPVRISFAAPLPHPPRCTTYEPAAVRVTGHQVTAAGVVLAVTARAGDAEALAALAREADELCTIGPAPGEGEAAAPAWLTVQYWRRAGRLLGGPAPTPALPRRHCRPYDPARLAVRPVARPTGAGGGRDEWVVASPAIDVLVQLATRAEADQALALARHYSSLCVIGRDSGDGTTVGSVFTYWR